MKQANEWQGRDKEALISESGGQGQSGRTRAVVIVAPP